MLPLLLLAVLGAEPPQPFPSPTPGSQLRHVHVLLDGVPVEGTAVSGERGRTLFQARLASVWPSHGSAPSVALHYDVPGTWAQLGRHTGDVPLLDDGTGGDDVADDGLYQRLDLEDDIGCGRAIMPAGIYVYTFRCLRADGHSCGEMTVRVERR